MLQPQYCKQGTGGDASTALRVRASGELKGWHDAALAIGLRADKQMFVSDVPGVLDANKAIVPDLDAATRLVTEGVIAGGMIPKVRSCLAAAGAGVGEVYICGFRDARTLEDQIIEAKNSGTIVR